MSYMGDHPVYAEPAPSVVFVTGDDWVALYIDGKKVEEGHSLHWSHVLDALGIKYEQQEAPKIPAEDVNAGHVIDVNYADRLEDVGLIYY